MSGILNSEIWPTTEQERALARKEEKQRLMIMRRLTKELVRPNQQELLGPQDSDIEDPVVETKVINKLRITTTAAKPSSKAISK